MCVGGGVITHSVLRMRRTQPRARAVLRRRAARANSKYATQKQMFFYTLEYRMILCLSVTFIGDPLAFVV